MLDKHSEAVTMMLEGRNAEALEILEQLDQTPEVLNDHAAALHNMGRTDEALELLDAALEKSPELMPAVLNHRYMKLASEATVSKPSSHPILEDWGTPAATAPLASVIIPTYNRPDFLEEAIQSILAQTMKDFEIIVVNDGGPPTAGEILKKIGSDRIRYIRIEHGGISAALNSGVVHARGKYVAYLDDDDTYLPDHLQTLTEYLEAHSETQVAYTFSLQSIQEQGDNGWETVDENVFYDGPFDINRLKKRGNIIQTIGCIMHRREYMEEIGGFNEKILGCQDWDWYIRASEIQPLRLIPKATLRHFVRKAPNMQLTGDPRTMRRSDMTVTYLHRQVFVPSHVPGRQGYRRAMKYLRRLSKRWPDVIDVLDFKEMMRRKPYAFLYRLGKDLTRLGEIKKARRAFWSAFKVSPWEIKTWGKVIRPSIHG